VKEPRPARQPREWRGHEARAEAEDASKLQGGEHEDNGYRDEGAVHGPRELRRSDGFRPARAEDGSREGRV
jgi:hypothetical protein